MQALNRATFQTYAPHTDVPETILRGITARRDTGSIINRKLTSTEESALIERILSMDQRGLGSTTDIVHQMANLLL
jgi:hypothetical protein